MEIVENHISDIPLHSLWRG